MKSRHTLVKIITLFIFTLVHSLPVFAIDLNYNPELDAPTEHKMEHKQTQPKVKKRLPGEKDPTNAISTEPLFLNNDEQRQHAGTESGWTVNAPTISSDKEPNSVDERQSVKMSEEQRWQEDGKNYDNNPLNKDNYRVNVEAEYTF